MTSRWRNTGRQGEEQSGIVAVAPEDEQPAVPATYISAVAPEDDVEHCRIDLKAESWKENSGGEWQ